MKNKMLKFICLSMAMLVTGCTQIHEENSSSNSKIEAPANVEYQDTVTLVTDPYGPLLNTSASTNDGYYELLLSADGTANNILYTDFATKQRIYLCNAPNCTHDKDSCTSWIDYISGGSYLFTSPDGQKLYYVQRGMEEDTGGGKDAGKIFVMNADGSERKVLLDIGADGRICDAIAADSQSLYIDINTVDSIVAEPKKQLWRVDASTGDVEILKEELPAGARIFSAFDTTIIFQTQEETSCTYKAYDLKTRSFSDLISWKYDDFDGVDIVYGHRLFVLKKQTEDAGALEVYDLRNMEKSVVQNVPIFSGDTTFFSGFFDEQNLFIDVTDNGDVNNIRFLRYNVNIETGVITELGLTYNNKGTVRPIGIYCDAGDALLVRYESYDGTLRSTYNGKLTEMQMVGAPRLGLISKEDYLLSNPNFVPVTDTVVSQ